VKRTLLSLASLVTLAALALGSGLPAQAESTTSAASSRTPFRGGLYVQADSEPAVAARSLRGGEKRAAQLIAKQPIAIWLSEWARGAKLTEYIERNLVEARAQRGTPVFVTYAIPDRDCGGHSAGGLSARKYIEWNATVASALRGSSAVVLVEPDSLSTLFTCSPQTVAARLPLIRKASARLVKAGLTVYLDAGTSGQHLGVEYMAQQLTTAGVANTRGFYTNVANYRSTTDEKLYASTLATQLGGAHYVIDVSRNGQGYSGEWCNAPGAGLGRNPKVTHDGSGLDALLWVKTPGASDGTCNGGPAAGAWFPKYAKALVARREG
jgi:endoglucanase